MLNTSTPAVPVIKMMSLPLGSVTVSTPPEGMYVSFPAPPLSVSLPLAPFSTSSPSPPFSISAPANTSLPSPPFKRDHRRPGWERRLDLNHVVTFVAVDHQLVAGCARIEVYAAPRQIHHRQIAAKTAEQRPRRGCNRVRCRAIREP